MVDDRTGMQSPRLRCRPPGKSVRNISVHPALRTGTEYVRISLFFGLSLRDLLSNPLGLLKLNTAQRPSEFPVDLCCAIFVISLHH
jgi:hypothetical protein